MAAADDPPETTIEPHLEMSYNKKMPGFLCRPYFFLTIYKNILQGKFCSIACQHHLAVVAKHQFVT